MARRARTEFEERLATEAAATRQIIAAMDKLEPEAQSRLVRYLTKTYPRVVDLFEDPAPLEETEDSDDQK